MDEKNNSYKQIFKSFGIIGGAQVVTILIGIIRTKVIAIILGPSGVGITGIFQNIIDLIRNATGFGINFSGVKKIADETANNNLEKLSEKIEVIRNWSVWTGLLGMLIMIAFSSYFNKSFFLKDNYSKELIFLSSTLLFTSISAGQLAVLQGLRKMRQMAYSSVFGAFFGTLISLPVYWFYKVNGIFIALIIYSISTLISTSFYSKDIKKYKVNLKLFEIFEQGKDLIKTGLFIVSTLFISSISLYILRIIIISKSNLVVVGLFQSVWTISNMYLSVLLNAMLADYFPRLSQLAKSDKESNELINQQLEITLLIGVPILIIMLSFSKLVVNILYSDTFLPAIHLLEWHIFSSFITLIIWPIGVIYLARNKGRYMLVAELIKHCIYLFTVYFGWGIWGEKVLGYGYFLAMIFVFIMSWISIAKISSFQFSKTNFKNIVGLFVAITFIFFSNLSPNIVIQFFVKFSISIISILYCLWHLNKRIDFFYFCKKLFSSSN